MGQSITPAGNPGRQEDLTGMSIRIPLREPGMAGCVDHAGGK